MPRPDHIDRRFRSFHDALLFVVSSWWKKPLGVRLADFSVESFAYRDGKLVWKISIARRPNITLCVSKNESYTTPGMTIELSRTTTATKVQQVHLFELSPSRGGPDFSCMSDQDVQAALKEIEEKFRKMLSGYLR